MKNFYTQIFSKFAAATLLACALSGCSKTDTSAGLAYLQKQDSKDLNALKQEIQTVRFTQAASQYKSGQLNLAAVFQDTIILGDSRAVALLQAGLITSDEIIAQIGVSSTVLADYVDELAARQPAAVIFTFGLNDMEHNFGNMEEDGYKNLIDSLMSPIAQACPDTMIFISSILPASLQRQSQMESFAHTDFYNDQLERLCQEKGWIYIDNSDLPFEEYYEPDGEHFTAPFLDIWAANMADALIEARSQKS